MSVSKSKGCLLQVDPYFPVAEYTEEEKEFIRAVEQYQKKYKRRFPTFVEVLRIARSLGYRKIHLPPQENV